MKTLQLSIAASGFLAGTLFAGQAAAAGGLCDYIGKACDNGCYVSTAKKELVLSSANTTEAGCESGVTAATTGDYLTYNVPLDTAPGPMALESEKVGSNRYAEVWPQGESITYSWSSAGGIVLDAASGTANPIRGFTCTTGTQGTITVTAYSPRGVSETLTQTVSCQ